MIWGVKFVEKLGLTAVFARAQYLGPGFDPMI
jgi:hypothetical protein